MMNVSLRIYSNVALWVTTMGFLWSLHRDVSNLRKEVGQDIADLVSAWPRVEGLILEPGEFCRPLA